MTNRMRKTKGIHACVSIFIALALVLTAGITPAQAITWGDPDPDGKFANVGAILVELDSGEMVTFCSGTLISPTVFLTAGHCTHALKHYYQMGIINSVYVSFSFAPMEKGAELLEVPIDFQNNIITHPDYKPQTNRPDVGLLILEHPLRGRRITPATLAQIGFLDQLQIQGLLRNSDSKAAKFTVVGYGGSLTWPPPVIYYPDIRQFTESEFQELSREWLRLSQNNALDNGGSCYGDSGGPIFWEEPDGSLILVAVTSWGDAQCVSASFTYRIDISGSRDFIDANLPS